MTTGFDVTASADADPLTSALKPLGPPAAPTSSPCSRQQAGLVASAPRPRPGPGPENRPKTLNRGSPAAAGLPTDADSGARREDLLAQDVRVAAMLGEFPEHVQVDPPQGQRAAPVTPDEVVKIERSGPPA